MMRFHPRIVIAGAAALLAVAGLGRVAEADSDLGDESPGSPASAPLPGSIPQCPACVNRPHPGYYPWYTAYGGYGHPASPGYGPGYGHGGGHGGHPGYPRPPRR
jgi:hypothetical protein